MVKRTSVMVFLTYIFLPFYGKQNVNANKSSEKIKQI